MACRCLVSPLGSLFVGLKEPTAGTLRKQTFYFANCPCVALKMRNVAQLASWSVPPFSRCCHSRCSHTACDCSAFNRSGKKSSVLAVPWSMCVTAGSKPTVTLHEPITLFFAYLLGSAAELPWVAPNLFPKPGMGHAG
jgi:hypothetical protein